MKFWETNIYDKPETSCPARGTWIEIENPAFEIWKEAVVPRKGHVD